MGSLPLEGGYVSSNRNTDFDVEEAGAQLKARCEEMFKEIMKGGEKEWLGPAWYGGAYMCMQLAVRWALKLAHEGMPAALELTEIIDRMEI